MGEKRFYNEQEAEQILKLASRRSSADGSMSREQLLSAAAELGIPSDALEDAEQEFFQKQKEKEDRAAFRKHVRGEFWGHFASYLVINGALVAFDVFRDGRLSWAFWPLAAWGIGIAFHAIGAFIGDSSSEKEFQKWRRKRDRVNTSESLSSDIEDQLLEISEEFDLEDEKVSAIRELRERTGLSLKEAKDAVEEYSRLNQ